MFLESMRSRVDFLGVCVDRVQELTKLFLFLF